MKKEIVKKNNSTIKPFSKFELKYIEIKGLSLRYKKVIENGDVDSEFSKILRTRLISSLQKLSLSEYVKMMAKDPELKDFLSYFPSILKASAKKKRAKKVLKEKMTQEEKEMRRFKRWVPLDVRLQIHALEKKINKPFKDIYFECLYKGLEEVINRAISKEELTT